MKKIKKWIREKMFYLGEKLIRRADWQGSLFGCGLHEVMITKKEEYLVETVHAEMKLSPGTSQIHQMNIKSLTEEIAKQIVEQGLAEIDIERREIATVSDDNFWVKSDPCVDLPHNVLRISVRVVRPRQEQDPCN